jgi:hypothetical protein
MINPHISPPSHCGRRSASGRTSLSAGLLTLLLVLGPGLPALATTPAVQGPDAAGLPLLAQANGVSLDEAVAHVQRRTGGRVLSAETRMENGAAVHHIRVLTDNRRVRTIRVDAQTGEWL